MRSIMVKKGTLRYIYFFLFFCSGFSGLIYESIWSNYLKLFLGHAAYAQVLVLSIFMGGMALGSWITARYSAKIQNLLLNYAKVEMAIGLFGIFFHFIYLQVTDFAYSSVIPKIFSAQGIDLFKWALASLLIFPQAVLLGSTFPLMSAGIIRVFPQNRGKSIALLYFTNSLGAAVGVLVSGFVLIKAVGLPGTIVTAGIINILIAAIVWLLSYNDSYNPNDHTIVKTKKEIQKWLSYRIFAVFLICAGLTGTASFIYEIVWIRMLTLVLGASTHAFELMLSAFILGLAIGSLWIRRRIDRLKSPIKTLGIIQVIMGILALSTLLIYDGTFNIMQYMISALSKTNQGYILFNLFSHSIAMVIMLPATICAGMTLPILTYYLVSQQYGEDSIGKVYAANMMGSIIGIILAVQLMPFFGLKNLLAFGAGIDIILGLALVWYAVQIFSTRNWIIITSISFTVIMLYVSLVQLDPLKLASGVFRHGTIDRHDKKILFHKDGKTASIDLVSSKDGRKFTILNNGKPDACIADSAKATPDEVTQVLLAAIPLSLHQDARNAAVIGLGSGMTSNILLKFPGIDKLDIIEIEPAMVEAARLLGSKVGMPIDNPRSQIHIEDAKTFFTSHNNKYDLIISEPSNSWVSGVSSLFSLEFYHLIRNYINEDGLFVQWMQLYEINISLVASVIKALSIILNDYVIYATSTDILIIANKNGAINELSDSIFDIPEMKSILGRVGIENVQDLALRKLGSRKTLDQLFALHSVQPNSDYFPVLDINAVKARYLKQNALDLIALRTIHLPLIETLEGSGFHKGTLSVSKNSYNKTGRLAVTAKNVFDYFRNVNSTSTVDTINYLDRKIVRDIKSIHHQCKEEELKTVWLGSLHAIAKVTLPYLYPNEMEIIWNDIESAKCFSVLPEETNYWFYLYRAVSRRDFENILKFSSLLLPEESIKPSTENEYLLTAAMLAYIALNEHDKAISLFKRYQNKDKPSLPIRNILYFANQNY